MNEQHVLDWTLVHGSSYRYEDLMEATGLTRTQLYRLRYRCQFGRRGVFSYGEACALVFAHNAHVSTHAHADVVQDLAWKIDHAPPDADTNVHIVEHEDGVFTAHACATVWCNDALVIHAVPLPLLASTLAHAHARVHDGEA